MFRRFALRALALQRQTVQTGVISRSAVLSAAFASRVHALPTTSHLATRSFAQSARQKEAPALFGTSGKYATALSEAVQKRGSKGDLRKISGDLKTFYDTYKTFKPVRDLLDNPILKPDQKKAKLNQALPTLKLHPIVQDFILSLVGFGQVDELKDIMIDFEKLVAYEMNEVNATVVSAEALSREQLDRVTASLKSRIDPSETLVLTQKVDPSILGGLVVSLDGRSLDLSVASQIKKIDFALRKH